MSAPPILPRLPKSTAGIIVVFILFMFLVAIYASWGTPGVYLWISLGIVAGFLLGWAWLKYLHNLTERKYQVPVRQLKTASGARPQKKASGKK